MSTLTLTLNHYPELVLLRRERSAADAAGASPTLKSRDCPTTSQLGGRRVGGLFQEGLFLFLTPSSGAALLVSLSERPRSGAVPLR